MERISTVKNSEEWLKGHWLSTLIYSTSTSTVRMNSLEILWELLKVQSIVWLQIHLTELEIECR